MKNNINYKRVRRIKAVIYLFLLLIVLLLAMLMVLAGLRLLDSRAAEQNIEGTGAPNSPALVGSPGLGSASGISAAEPPVIDASSSRAQSEPSRAQAPEPSGGAAGEPARAGGDLSPAEDRPSEQVSTGSGPADSQSLAGPVASSRSGQPLTAEESAGDTSGDYGDYGDVYDYQEIPNTGFPKPGEMD
ncbi:MAG: hypothetical protein LBU86_06625 [Oscillospiraceae bacterium]|jgi:hypothetical protein|nr:hypothetical protein [Oscillospiraceae bacterium]